MNARNTLLVVGLLAAAAGLAMAYAPTVAAVVEAPQWLPFLVSVLALAGAIYRMRSWLAHEERDFDPVELERPTAVGVPGDGFDHTLAIAPPMGSGGGRGGADTRRVRLRESLREAAEETLVRFQGYGEDDAEAAVARGTWTDDRLAAEFFTSPTGTGNSALESVRSSVYGEGPFKRRARAAAVEIERQTRGPDDA